MNTFQVLSRYYLFFAAGDAIGKTTEFMTLDEISTMIGPVRGLLDSSKSKNHRDLESWAVTDDTEQNIFLLRRYLKDRQVSIDNTVDALVDWIDTTDAVAKRYVGPSSLRALQNIKAGGDPLMAGIGGTTCGGIMRVPSSVFASLVLNLDFDQCVYDAVVPTHNTSVAMESAYAYAYALRAAMENGDIIKAARTGCKVGLSKVAYQSASARLVDRLDYLEELNVKNWPEEKLKKFLYGVFGTGLPSYETAAAVFALVMYTDSPQKAMFLAAEMGGDTDTIAALAGGLLSVVNGTEQLDKDIRIELEGHNDLAIML